MVIKNTKCSCEVKESHFLIDETNVCCNVTQSHIVHQFILSVSDILILLFTRYLD